MTAVSDCGALQQELNMPLAQEFQRLKEGSWQQLEQQQPTPARGPAVHDPVHELPRSCALFQSPEYKGIWLRLHSAFKISCRNFSRPTPNWNYAGKGILEHISTTQMSVGITLRDLGYLVDRNDRRQAILLWGRAHFSSLDGPLLQEIL